MGVLLVRELVRWRMVVSILPAGRMLTTKTHRIKSGRDKSALY